jgi:hypothetical protein
MFDEILVPVAVRDEVLRAAPEVQEYQRFALPFRQVGTPFVRTRLLALLSPPDDLDQAAKGVVDASWSGKYSATSSL